MKTRGILNDLKKIVDDEKSLKEFVMAYFMTYDYERGRWEMSLFDNMVKNLAGLEKDSNISGTAEYKAELKAIVEKLVEQKKRVEKEYYDSNAGLFGTLQKSRDWLFPASKIPDHILAFKDRLSEKIIESTAVAESLSKAMGNVSVDQHSKLASTSIPGTRAQVNMSAQLAGALKGKADAIAAIRGGDKGNTK